jgi:hypothetical protein
MLNRLPSSVDHLVLATPDLDATVAELEQRIGVRATPGGSHPDRGTRNALIALSESSYLEIVGPDLAQPRPTGARWFGIDSLSKPRIMAWAAKSDDVPQLVADAHAKGVMLGKVSGGSRRTATGVTLRWTFTDPDAMVDDGMVPFFIDWGNSPHPASTSPYGPGLVSLVAEHPDPVRVARSLSAVGVSLDVNHGSRPALVATLSGPTGNVELR